MTSLFPVFLSLLLVRVGNSFAPLTEISPISANTHDRNLVVLNLHVKKGENRRCGAKINFKHGKTKHHGSPKRVPQNKRTAIRWVIQGVERCLAEDDKKSGEKSYKRRIDASLVDALFLMVNANTQADVMDAEKRVQVLMKNPNEFPNEVNERVIKATAMAGLSNLSLTLLKAFLVKKNDTIPSLMAYTAVLNVLRKNGRIEQLEETLADLAGACRRVSHKTGEKVGVDIVAFNTYVAALCDAAVLDLPFSSAADGMDENDSGFNYTSLTNSSATSSSSEKYLYKALNLLRGDAARTRFALDKDPDEYSYNSVLNAAAKCCESEGKVQFSKSIMLSCLKGMKDRRLRPDSLTYNARIQAALASDGEEAAVRIIDQVLSDPNVEPDRYTINFMLKPFINAGRRDEIWSVLNDFFDENAGSGGLVSSAFEAFLTTIVQTGEVEFARELFQAFFLPIPKHNRHFEMLQEVHVLNEEEMKQQKAGTAEDSSSTPVSKSYDKDSIDRRSHPQARTRHFNILFGGYSKAYQSAISKHGKARVLTTKNDANDTEVELDGAQNITMPNIHRAYELLDVMLGIGVPLDGYSVSSLMSLPYSNSEDITSLLERIEPEMMVQLNPAAYRSIISAYGKAGDPSSACWMFEEMTKSCRHQGKSSESWNTLLGALSRGCVGTSHTLDIPKSVAAQARRKLTSEGSSNEVASQLISLVNGKTCLDASMAILDAMRSGSVFCHDHMPKPNSQTYCLVASAISESGTSEPNGDLALDLFHRTMEERVPADGRFLNAVVRCFGDDVDGALAAWKTEIGPAAAEYERISNKRGTNVIAAYNGLMHVCGRAIRPDIATRITYAMNKAGVEPSEVTLNSYLAGKRVALDGNDDGKNLGLQRQYESLLAVECTKYNSKDKRRANDRKIRIIL